MNRRFGSLWFAVLAVALMPLLAHAAGNLGAPLPARASHVPAVDPADVLSELNLRRVDAGLSPLQYDDSLGRAAADRAADLFARRYFEHVAPDGTQPFVWVDLRGYRYAVVGENLAVGQRSAKQVVDEWMASPGHRANILEADYRDAGLAIVPGSPVGRTRGFTFVALFGAKQREFSASARR